MTMFNNFSKFDKFDKKTLQSLHNEMNEVLRKYGMDANLDFEVGNIKFSPTEAEIKVKAKISGAKPKTSIVLQTRVEALGIKIENDEGDRLVEYRTSNWKMPFIYKSADGRLFKCDEATAKVKFA